MQRFAPRHAHAHAALLQRGDRSDRLPQPHRQPRAQSLYQAVETHRNHLVPAIAAVGIGVILRRAGLW